MRPYILKAIIKRDFKETFRNPQSLIIIGITLALNILLAVAVSKPLWLMTFSMSLVMVGFTITSFTVMEEKEKRTLEALLVSPANYSEILFGKLFVTFSTTVLITLGLVYSLHLKEISVVHTLLSVPIGAFIICLFGMVIGLICPSQAALSSFGTILMLILFLPELLASNNETIGHLARALPTHHVIQISSLANEGMSILILKHYAILILSFFATIYWVLSFVKTSAKQESSFIKIERSNIYSTIALIAVLSFGSFVLFPEKRENRSV